MATLAEMHDALINADKAGDTAAAQQLADAIYAMQPAAKPDISLLGQINPKPPVEVPGIAESLLIGTGRTFDRIGKGMQQMYYGATGNDAKQASLKDAAQEDDRIYKELQKARPFATGIGEGIPSVILPGGGATTVLGNMARMGAAAGIPAALEYGSVGERAVKAGISGAAGAAGAALPVLGTAFNTGKSLLEPLYAGGRDAIAGRMLNRVAGPDAPNAMARMLQATPIVPGSLPTAAQVAENGGIAALERSMSGSNPSAYTSRFMDQASARLGALRGVAGDDAAMAAAVSARDAAKQGLYSQADIGLAPIDAMFKGLQQRPQFNAAVARAEELAKDKGLQDIFFRDTKGQPIALIGEGAHFIKKALDEAGEYGSKSYMGKASAGTANNTNQLFQTWLDKSIPEYGMAKQAYASGSKPINQMEIGKALLDKVQPALADFGALGRETGATYGLAMRNADALAAKSTGFPGATMDSVLTPTQMAAVTNVAKDLARKANAQDLGRGVGSDTFQKLSMQNIAQQSGMPTLTAGLLSLPGVSRATNWLYRDSDAKLQAMMADVLLNPKNAATLMQGGKGPLSNPHLRQLLEQSAIRGGSLLGGAAAAQP